MSTGVPGDTSGATRRIPGSGTRIQPCDGFVPAAAHSTPRAPWIATRPGPPANSNKTFECAVRWSAQGPRGLHQTSRIFWYTAKCPLGVGVDGAPNATPSLRTTWPLRNTRKRCRRRLISTRIAFLRRITLDSRIHAEAVLGRDGSRTLSHDSPVASTVLSSTNSSTLLPVSLIHGASTDFGLSAPARE